MFKVDETDSYLEECAKAKKMLDTFSDFASKDHARKYEAEIVAYTSSIKKLNGFNVKVYLLSPYNSCDRELQVHNKSGMDADISAARMGLSTTLMECLMVLPRQMRYNWNVLKQTTVSKYENPTRNKMLIRNLRALKLESCVGHVGDLCILKNRYTGLNCTLKCKWHGQYDLFDTDTETKAFEECRRITHRLPVLKKGRKREYPIICNKNYTMRVKGISYECIGNKETGYYVYRQQTELELSRRS